MEIPVVDIRSEITTVDKENVAKYFGEIEKDGQFKFKMVSIDEYAKCDFGLIFIATGGSEGIFLKNFGKLGTKPCYILTSGKSNSFAASLEILSYLQSKGQQGEILHGAAETVAARVKSLFMAANARKNIRGKRVACLGKPSDWLIASQGDAAAYQSKLGLDLIEISMDELQSEIKKGGYPENEWTEKLLHMNYAPAEMEKSLNVYGAFKRLADRYQLAGLTVRCFDLLDTVFTTGCLGLAILNAEGIYGGCEGDVPALVSMMILSEVSGQPVFLCNPNRIDTAKSEMVFAHCTLPLNMPQKMALTTHYESGIGVAIHADLPEGPVTIFKTSGDLSRYMVQEGQLLENLFESAMCRTQIRVKLPDYSYFMKRPISNHHLICIGKYKEAIDAFFTDLGDGQKQ